MKIVMFGGAVEAEGTEGELAVYTYMILEVFRRLKEKENQEAAEREAGLFAELMRIPLDELIKREQEGDGK